jgi:hypothetical protein
LVSKVSSFTQPLSSAARLQRGLPRRVSSIPSTLTGSGSGSCAQTAATNAECAAGQPSRPAPAVLTGSPSPIRSATCRRSRPVTRAPAGTSPICSVNARRAHAASRQAYWTLCQRTASGSSP